MNEIDMDERRPRDNGPQETRWDITRGRVIPHCFPRFSRLQLIRQKQSHRFRDRERLRKTQTGGEIILKNILEFYGNTLAALDGDIGRVKDFYFDDQSWVIRYLAVETSSWLAGRVVLLSPHSLGKWAPKEKTLQVKMLKKRIQNSPPLDLHKPLSRQYEIEYYRYYGWLPYWEGGARWGLGDYPVMLPPLASDGEVPAEPPPRHDQPLQSTLMTTGYVIQGFDGTIGQLSGCMVDNESWAIQELVVETGSSLLGREILISPNEIERISYAQSKIFLTFAKTAVLRAAESGLAKASA